VNTDQESTSNKAARGAGWLISGRGISSAIGFVNTIILARLLTPDDFGVVALAATLIGITEAVTDMPVGRALIRMRALGRAHYDSAWTMSLIRGAILFIALLSMAYILPGVVDEPRLTPIMAVLAVLMLVMSASNPKFIIFERNLDYRYEIITLVISRVLAFGVGASIAYIYQTYWALIAANSTGLLVKFIFSYIYVPYLPKFSMAKAREIWAFTSWLTLGAIMDAVNQRFDKLMVGINLPRSDMGLYDMGDELAKKPTNDLLVPMTRPLFPALSSIIDDKERAIAAYKKSQSLLFAIALPFGIGFSVIAEPTIKLLLDDRWLDTIFIVQVLAVVFAFQSLIGPANSLAQAAGKTKSIFYRQTAFFILRLPIIAVALLAYGITGLVLARLMTGLIYINLNLVMVKHILGISVIRQILPCWRSIISVSIMATTVLALLRTMSFDGSFFVSILFLLSLIISGALTYISIHLTLWLLSGKPAGAESYILSVSRDFMHKMLKHKANRTR
jgi:PST family polysaccharide transporter